MAWTTPKDWAVDELLTATNMNTHVRDNLSHLGGFGVDGVTFGAMSQTTALCRMATGSYTGNGADNRAMTGVGFQPKELHIMCSAYGEAFRRVGMTGDVTRIMGGTSFIADNIQSIDSDGFTLGTGGSANGSGHTYYWIAFG